MNTMVPAFHAKRNVSQNRSACENPRSDIIVVTVNDLGKFDDADDYDDVTAVIERCRTVQTNHNGELEFYFRRPYDSPELPQCPAGKDAGYTLRYGSVDEIKVDQLIKDCSLSCVAAQCDAYDLINTLIYEQRAPQVRELRSLALSDLGDLLDALGDWGSDDEADDDGDDWCPTEPYAIAAKECYAAAAALRQRDPRYQAALAKFEADTRSMKTAYTVERPRIVVPPMLWLHSERDRFSLDELTIPPPPHEFAFPGIFPVGVCTVITGAGGSSKTGFTAACELSICVGGNFLGRQCVEGKTLHLSAEDDRDVFLRHVYSNTQYLDRHQRNLVLKNLHVKDLVGSGTLLTRFRDGTIDVAPEVDHIVEYAKGIDGLRVVVFDTLSRLHGGEEDNPGLAAFIRAGERVAQATRTAVVILHHTGKAQKRASMNDQYSSRGGTALSDNARSVLNLTALEVDKDEIPTNAREIAARGDLIRVSHVKSNYAPKSGDHFLERVHTPHQARIVEFVPEWKGGGVEVSWGRLREWFASNSEVPYPTASTIDALGDEYGTRRERRDALQFARDRGLLVDVKHPTPSGQRKTYLSLPDHVLDDADEGDAESFSPIRRDVAGEVGELDKIAER